MPSRRDPSLRPSLGVAGATARRRDALRLSLLGGFELEVGSRAVRLPHHVQRLLAFLALESRPMHRAYVAGRLWIDHSQEHAHGCLRTTLWRLGRLSCPAVDATSTHLSLATAVHVDARELVACVERVLRGVATPPGEDLDLLVHAADLLPDWYDDWVSHKRERLRQLRLVALEAVGESRIVDERYADATVAALAAIAGDPLRESSYRLLIRSYIKDGNVAEALRQFGLIRTRLRRLGLEPSPQLRELPAEDHEQHLVETPWSGRHRS